LENLSMTNELLSTRVPFAVVVNDDPTQLAVLTGLIAEAGLTPRSYTSAEVALADFSACTRAPSGISAVLPSLIVTDLCMPGIDGWQFCRLLHSAEYSLFNDVPILAVSAPFSGDESQNICADLGSAAFLPVPVDGKRFLEQVKDILDGKRQRLLPRVLIVEDSKTQADIFTKALASNGYRPDSVLNAQEACVAFDDVAYDVVLLDYHLPDSTGDALLDLFHAQRPDCIFLMMTADSGQEFAQNWIRRGAFAYLHKPFLPGYLIELCALGLHERGLLRARNLLEARTRELHAREELLNATQRLAKVGGWEWDIEAKRMAWTEEVYRIHDLDEKDLLLNSSEQITKVLGCYAPADQKLLEAAFTLCADHGMPFDLELPLTSYKERQLWIRIGAQPVVEKGRIVKINGHIMDITERKQKDAEIAQHEQYLTTILQTTVDGFLVVDTKGKVIDVNETYCAKLGYTKAEMLELRLEDIEPVEEAGGDAAARTKRIIENGSELFETRHRRKDGSLFDVENSVTYMARDGGEFVNFCRDISERKRAEAEKAKLEADLQQAQRMESVGRLAGGVAHDFNNMLQSILGNAELAMMGIPPGSRTYGHIEEICTCAQRSSDLTRQLLAFARKQTIAPRALDLNETIKGIFKMLKRLIGEEIDIQWKPAADLWPILMDQSQMDQILANLCINARDAITGIGIISIETSNCTIEAESSNHREYVRLVVSDTGCGMDQETISHIFEPFYTTKGIHKGTGLGLSTVYGAVEQNEGFVTVESTVEQGTTFIVHLPRYTGEIEQIEKEEGTEPTRSGQETILVIEDEPSILQLITMLLEVQDYTVLAAVTPREALALAREHAGKIHLIITDVIMPEMNGRELAREMLSIYPEIKCLFMSGYTAETLAPHGVLDASVEFIAKPFATKDLVVKVRRILDEE
jgi:PAS domain S-box-containing protein